MAICKCKMCGGDLDITEGASIAVCEYCGSKQTLPRLDDERKINLYDRASHFRRNNEFDKAEGIYEQILNEDTTDAEAYWSLVLCRYGIEYVEDPSTHKRVPTVNRAQFTSIFADENYKKAIEYADPVQREVYEAEAKAIDEIQKGILEISSKEEPFDVFICYKETDANGRRTPDSVLATDLYHQLTNEGFKVFFSRITLEDKLGSAYEPYIFAALNSAKAMVVLGTKPEYFNAVWVKNEWSRYLALIRGGAKKTLIPAYRDMDPYDLPEEFSHLQAQDMSKLGFMQDLIRGIRKILEADKPQEAVHETVVVQQTAGNANLTAQIKRGQQALEDRDWQAADGFFDKALDMDAECAEAFYGKALAAAQSVSAKELVVRRVTIPVTQTTQLEACKMDQAAVEQAAEQYTVPGYLEEKQIRACFDNIPRKYASLTASWEDRIRQEKAYWEKDRLMSRAVRYAKGELADGLAKTRGAVEAGLQQKLADSRTADEQQAARVAAAYVLKMAEAKRKAEALYEPAAAKREAEYQAYCQEQGSNNTETLEAAARHFEQPRMRDYKDSAERALQCRQKIQELDAEKKARDEAEREAAKQKAERERIEAERAEKARRRKNTTVGIIVAALAVLAVAGYLLATKVIIPEQKYKAAEALFEAGQYEEAITAFEAMDGYKDSDARIEQCRTGILDRDYDNAIALLNTEEYDKAITAFEALHGYKESDTFIQEAKRTKATFFLESGEYEKAYALFNDIGDYEAIKSSKHERANAFLESKDYEAAYALLQEIDAKSDIVASKRERANAFLESKDYEAAYALLQEIDAKSDIVASKRERAKALLGSEDYEKAYSLFKEIGDNGAIMTSKRNRANALLDSGDYDEAYSLLGEIGETELIKTSKHDRAIALLESEDYDEAYSLLNDIGDKDTIADNKRERAEALYGSNDFDDAIDLLQDLHDPDSQNLITRCYIGKHGEETYHLMKNIKTSKTYTFGSYEQDNNTNNGKEPIEWIVLDVEGSYKDGMSFLLISKYVIESRMYSQITDDYFISWNDCWLRKWLNESFINSAFSTKEQKLIQDTSHSDDDNTDKVFLLDEIEAKRYFASDENRACLATAYAVAKYAVDHSNDLRYDKVDKSLLSLNSLYWILRNPSTSHKTYGVYPDGEIDSYSGTSLMQHHGIRPAIWIKIG